MEKRSRKICLIIIQKIKNRNFSEVYYTRKMSNGELIDRQWLMHSEKRKMLLFSLQIVSKWIRPT